MSQTTAETRRVVFMGGPSRNALARFFRASAAASRQEVLALGPGGRARLAPGDLIAIETDLGGDDLAESALPAGVTLVRFPSLQADFLWPFAGRPHKLNRASQTLPPGPFNGEHGDRFLDELIEQGVPAEDAVRRYLELDIAKEADLDRKLERRLRVARKLDKQTGFALADVLESKFRQERLFASRGQPAGALLKSLLAQLLPRLGAAADIAEATLTRVEAKAGEQPLHPGVITHFGLSYVSSDAGYALAGECVTFQQYCRLYLGYTGNRQPSGEPMTADAPQAAEADEESAPEPAMPAAEIPRAEPASAPPSAAPPVVLAPRSPMQASPGPLAPEPVANRADTEPLGTLAAVAPRPDLPFELPPEPAPAPKKKSGFLGRLFGG